MRWRGRRQSRHVEDRRAMRSRGLGGASMGGGMLRLLPLAFRMLGPKGGTVLVLGVLALGIFGGDLGGLLQGPDPQRGISSGSGTLHQSPAEEEAAQFVSVVLADTEDTWHSVFAQSGERYREPTLVLYRGLTQSACGAGQAAMGPFYCPLDQTVYIDLSFYDELRDRHGAPGDFAQAYVIAHEVGHHVQNLLGVSEQVRKARGKMDKRESNQLSVRQELQADCLAGIWAHHADRSRDLLESGDIEEGLRAASAIGDDTLQRQSQGRVVPESFTHGSSEQRVRWFRRGYREGSVAACDTFSAKTL